MRSLLIAIVLVCLVPVSQGAEAVQWKFKAGQALRMQMQQDMKTDIDAGPQGVMTNTVKQVMSVLFKVESVAEDGVATVAQTIERIQFDAVAPTGQETHYDSDSDAPPEGMAAMVAPMFDAMAGSTFKMKMSPRGEVTDVEVDAKLAETLKNNPLAKGAGSMVSEEGIKRMSEQSAMKLPEGTLEKGQSWTTSVEVEAPMIGKQRVDTTYQYVGPREVEGRTLEVFSTNIEMSMPEDKNRTMQVSYGDQESKGEVLFDTAAGRPVSGSVNQKFTMNMNLMGQAITSKTDQSVVSTWSEVE